MNAILHLTQTPRPRLTPHPLTEAEHHALAAGHGGTPIIFREADGYERQAIRLPNGEILVDYRKEIAAVLAALTRLLTTSASLRKDF